MDVSKAFNAVNDDLIIAKLEGYRLSATALMYMRSYLNNRKQRVNVNKSFSSWESIIAGAPVTSLYLTAALFQYFPEESLSFYYKRKQL